MIRIKIKPIVVASTLIIIGGIGSLPLGCPWSISAILVIVGIIGNLWHTYHSERGSEELLALIDAQATLLSHKKLGNTYVEKLKHDLYTKGRTINFHALMKKAIENDPYNPDVILFYSRWSALWLSHCKRFKYLSQDHILNESKKLIAMSEYSLKQDPNNYEQRDVLGIVYDIIGLHDKAREQFYQSGKFRNDFYWLSFVATSWMMEEKYDKALECIENAISKGAKGLDYEYGGILQANGRYQEAYKYLKNAFKQKLFKIEIVDELVKNLTFQCKYFSASYYIIILSAIKLKHSYKQASISFGGFAYLFLMGSISAILRFITRCANIFILPKIITRKIHYIYEPHLSTSKILLQKGHYEQAEIISSQVSCFNNIHILNILAISQARQGKKQEAISTIDKALRIYQNNEMLLHNRKAFTHDSYGKESGRLIGIDRKGQLHFPNLK